MTMRVSARAFLLAAAAFAAGCGDPSEGDSNSVVAGSSAGSAQADSLFDPSVVHDIHLTMSPADWQSILNDSMGDTFRPASVQWREHVAHNVGVRPRGHSTRHPGNPKFSLKIEMDAFVPDQEFLGLDEIKLDGLREPTQMREHLAYALFREMGLAAPRTAYCRLFVNGEHRGVYLIEEAVNRDLVKHRYGKEQGNLYHVYVGNPESYSYLGSSPSLYIPRPWGAETNLDGDHSIVPRFLDILNHRTAELDGIAEVEHLIIFLALEVALCSRDTLLRDDVSPQNHFTYWRPSTGRFTFIPWDLDQCLTNSRAFLSMWHNFHHSAVTRVVQNTPALNARFRQKVSDVIEQVTHPDRMAVRIDALYQQIRGPLHADPYKLPTNSELDTYPSYLKGVFRSRYDSLRAELQVQ